MIFDQPPIDEEKHCRDRITTCAAQVVREKERLAKLIENRRYLRNEAKVVDFEQYQKLKREIETCKDTIMSVENAGKRAARDLARIEKQKTVVPRSNVVEFSKKKKKK